MLLPAHAREAKETVVIKPGPLARSTCRLVLLVAAGSVALYWEHASASQHERLAEAKRPIAVHAGGYVSSQACRSCHARQYQSWFASYHRRMTQLASPETVLGDFSDVSFGDAPHYRLQRDGDRFLFGQADDLRSPLQRAAITLVTGSHHMQIYWYETGDTRKLGQVPFVYLNADRRWVPRAAVFLEPPKAPRRPDESGVWSRRCIDCHATHGQPRVSDDGRFDTHVVEFGIACEACHGPGAEHVAAYDSPLERYQQRFGAATAQHIVQPQHLDHRRASQICSQCHSLWQDRDAEATRAWNERGSDYRPGDDMPAAHWLVQPSRQRADSRVDAVIQHAPAYVAGQFWSDGTARVSGREFNGMIDSPCYVSGQLSCLSCHTLHKRADDPRSVSAWADDQLGAGMESDRACLQCHEAFEAGDRRSAHTQHRAESEASRCYNCHMPHTSYGLLKAIRSHRISIPSAGETLQTGRPNACNLCHLDKSLGWTASQLQARQGVAASSELPTDARDVELALWLGLTGDAGQRALIAAALGRTEAQGTSDLRFAPALLGVLMDDPYDAVRYIAERSLRSLPGLNLADVERLQYDFVSRPETRAPVAQRIAGLRIERPQHDPYAAADDARIQGLIQRLLPLRDQRPVTLLE